MPRTVTARFSALNLSLVFALALALASGAAAAKQYEIEVIVFDRPDALAAWRTAFAQDDVAQNDAPDDTPPDHAQPQPDDSQSAREQLDFSASRAAARLRRMDELAGEASARATFTQLGRLEVARLGLIKSGYRILNTTRWQQPTSTYRHAPLMPLGRPDSALSAGFVRVYTTSLIYADLDLRLSPPLQLEPSAHSEIVLAPPPVDAQPHYFIAEKRRLKFNQIHYFDHPLFGAILGVWATGG
ncbi:MAG: CsiV family protein [bacterium]